MKRPGLFFRRGIWSLLSLMLIGFFILSFGFLFIQSQLPDVETLKDVHLQVPMRIYTSNNKLIAEFGEKKRTPITMDQVPKQLIQAILATEDQRFYEHPGVDIWGLGRAAIELIRTGSKKQGGSTITMQVARNFFLSSKKTYGRKINEILLAIKIENELSKNKILELYLNKIYLGNRAYGVAAAAHIYYGETLDQLTLAQMAMIAGLPKAPSRLNPIANPDLAKSRRNHVLARMLDEGFLDLPKYEQAIHQPITAKLHGTKIAVYAPYVAEMIRQLMLERFGKDAYTQGYQIVTTIDSKSQLTANAAVTKALIDYDTRHGYRGPLAHITINDDDDAAVLSDKLDAYHSINGLKPAIVTTVNDRSIEVQLKDQQTVTVDWSGLLWARPQLDDGYVGGRPKKAQQIVKRGDIVRVQQLADNTWRLAQVPNVEGALIALNPQDGAIKAIVGGFAFRKSKYNRVIQAQRQAGSAFKPFIYSAALSKGYTLASVINDAPVVLDDPSQENLWRPQNDTRKFYGPTRLRLGLIRSRNLVSIRLLESIGISYALDYLKNFGFDPKELPKSLSLALGSGSITPLQLASGYAVLANGGFRVEPYIIDHINDSFGNILLKAKPQIACPQCESEPDKVEIPDDQQAKRVIDDRNVYLMTIAMRDVINRGTGRAALVLRRKDLAGKTGTTNNQVDAWFSGFNSNLVVTSWVGYDNPQSLHEYAAKSALPMWIDFMKVVLRNVPEQTLVEPPGLVSVKIDPKTGLLAAPGQSNAIFEIFRDEYAPKQMATPNGDSGPYQTTEHRSESGGESSEPIF